jgi:hypothetical protein
MFNAPAILAYSCAQLGVQPVLLPTKTVFELCKFFAQTLLRTTTLRIIPSLYAGLSAAYALFYPRPKTNNNRGLQGLIPTMHSPNNKNYMVILKNSKGKTVEKQVL